MRNALEIVGQPCCGALQWRNLIGKQPWPSVSRTSRNKFNELRITQAYIALLCIPENADGARTVSLEWIGNHEVRIFETSHSGPTEAPLFWMELFDHGGPSSVDSCSCYEIEQAAIAFEGFVAQAKHSDEPPPPDGNATRS
jgi:hypothetical protein